MHQTEFVVQSRGVGLYEVTREICGWVADSGCEAGLLTLLVRHTSCSLLIQENADPGVQVDLEAFLQRLVPEGDPLWTHTAEGPDDMPAHVRTALTTVTLSVPITGGRLALGTWQGIYLWEHRHAGHHRQVAVHLLGE